MYDILHCRSSQYTHELHIRVYIYIYNNIKTDYYYYIGGRYTPSSRTVKNNTNLSFIYYIVLCIIMTNDYIISYTMYDMV